MSGIGLPTAAERAERSRQIADDLGRADMNVVAEVLTQEHPTRLGQIAKAVGKAVVRRADYDPEWKPWDGFKRPLCRLPRGLNYAEFSDKAWEHPEHDGRLDCSTVVGAILMARQSYI